MPIYAYRCAACGHAKDVLQKVSDPVLTVCPACGASAFQKQVTAAGFQLKGSGWYVTDFRDGGSAANKTANGSSKGGDAEKAADGAAKTSDASGDKSAGGDSSGSNPASSAPASAPAASTTSSAPSGDAN